MRCVEFLRVLLTVIFRVPGMEQIQSKYLIPTLVVMVRLAMASGIQVGRHVMRQIHRFAGIYLIILKMSISAMEAGPMTMAKLNS